MTYGMAHRGRKPSGHQNLVVTDGFLRRATHLIHDRDPVFTEAWTALLQDRRRDLRAHSGAESKLQPACGTVRKDGPRRVLGSLRHLRRAPPAASDPRVRRPLPHRALPPKDLAVKSSCRAV